MSAWSKPLEAATEHYLQCYEDIIVEIAELTWVHVMRSIEDWQRAKGLLWRESWGTWLDQEAEGERAEYCGLTDDERTALARLHDLTAEPDEHADEAAVAQ